VARQVPAKPQSRARSGAPPEVVQDSQAKPQGARLSRAETEVLHVGDAAIARIAARQYGVVTRAELTGAGLTRGAIAHRIAHGRLHRLHRGVYLVGHPVLAGHARELAAVLACGSAAVLGYRAATALWGLVPPPDEIDVIVVGRQVASRSGIRLHCVAAIDRRDVRVHKGIRVTAPARTLLDLAAVASAREVEQAVAEAYGWRLTSHRDLTSVLNRAGGTRGAALLRSVIDTGPRLTRSEAEARLLALIRAARLPAPAVNARIAGHEVDFVWRHARLAVEVDGYAFHSSRAAFERDRRRDGELQAAGWRVLRLTWRQIVEQPEAVVALVAAALAAAPTLRS